MLIPSPFLRRCCWFYLGVGRQCTDYRGMHLMSVQLDVEAGLWVVGEALKLLHDGQEKEQGALADRPTNSAGWSGVDGEGWRSGQVPAGPSGASLRPNLVGFTPSQASTAQGKEVPTECSAPLGLGLTAEPAARKQRPRPEWSDGLSKTAD